jgi:arsenate reductase (glutaredoxin)
MGHQPRSAAEGKTGMTTRFPIVIYHNPDCGTSRNVLQIVRSAGYEPVVVEYLQNGWTILQLQTLFAAAGLSPKEALRTTKSPAAELSLLGDDVSEDTLLKAMIEHPVLVNRPFVATPKGVRLCRPSEVVLDLLDRLPPGPLAKEDGELIVDAEGHRVSHLPNVKGSFGTRPAQPADADAMAAIYNQGIADRVATFETAERTAADIGKWFDGKHPIMVATDANGEVAAYAATFAYADRCAYSGVAEFSVYTRRDVRGRGAGKAAMAALIQAAPDAKLWKLVSRVFPENLASRALLRSVGFREIGVHERHGQLDGDWRDVIVVERLIPDAVSGRATAFGMMLPVDQNITSGWNGSPASTSNLSGPAMVGLRPNLGPTPQAPLTSCPSD